SGKSSIINCLLREDASIVSNSAGTTRDSIEYELQINNKIVKITDTAGLRLTDDEIEKEGIARSLKSISKADKIFYVVDHSKGFDNEDKKFIKTFEIEHYSIIYNKIDIKGVKPIIIDTKPSEIYISAINNDGLELIKSHIDKDFINIDSSENLYLARSRQVKFLEDAYNRVNSCIHLLEDESFDIIAQELAEGHLALSSILGQNPTEELLNEIFSEFCIGK
ncbi:MAG: GTPase, partial [Gammaproteobacteria bacterium]